MPTGVIRDTGVASALTGIKSRAGASPPGSVIHRRVHLCRFPWMSIATSRENRISGPAGTRFRGHPNHHGVGSNGGTVK